jgi:CPA1 family monovalent cation:H+ antiporter
MVVGAAGEHITIVGTLLLLALAAALVVGVVASRLRIPYSVALLLASLPIQAAPINSGFSAVVLLVLVPALVFEAAWNTPVAVLRRVWVPVTVLAVPGVLIASLAIAAGLSITHELPFAAAFIVGASLSATDPIAVIAVFRRLAVPEDLKIIVEGESLFNDGLAIVLYGLGVAIALGAHAGGVSGLAPDAVKVVVVAGGGSLVGFLCALALTALVRLAKENSMELQIVATVIAAFGAFFIAEHLGVSGIFATVVAGLSLRGFRYFAADEETVEVAGNFWGVLAFLANALVFLFLGLRVDVPSLWFKPDLIAVTLICVILARVVTAYGLLPLTGVGRRLGTPDWYRVVFIAGMRGALSLALVLALPPDVPNRTDIIDAVAGVVVITLIVQGLAIGPLLQRLKL